jgi:hypothetical protein
MISMFVTDIPRTPAHAAAFAGFLPKKSMIFFASQTRWFSVPPYSPSVSPANCRVGGGGYRPAARRY